MRDQQIRRSDRHQSLEMIDVIIGVLLEEGSIFGGSAPPSFKCLPLGVGFFFILALIRAFDFDDLRTLLHEFGIAP